MYWKRANVSAHDEEKNEDKLKPLYIVFEYNVKQYKLCNEGSRCINIAVSIDNRTIVSSCKD